MTSEAPDYKSTLNLPETDFPMRAGLPKREPDWLERWARIGVYDRLREKAGRAPFTLHDGPPYANGNLHIGHALNKTLKDMVVRSRQMMGHDARYVPGWDCHGLPIEWKIEEAYRKKGRDKDAVDMVEFRRECRDFAAGWVDVQREEFKRLGITGNWADPYLTMDFHAEAVIAAEFQTFLMNGLVYQGSKPVMWSPVEKTALAEAEVEYHDRQTDAIWVAFPVISAQSDLYDSETAYAEEEEMQGARAAETAANLAREKQLGAARVLIWTTTPWTIPQNRAICFGPGIAYGLYEVTGRPEECWARIGQTYLIADALAEQALGAARLEPSMYRRLRDVQPEELAALVCAHPLRGAEGAGGEWDYDVPLFPGDHITGFDP
jgi:isoleucyl-tRNA synthetase